MAEAVEISLKARDQASAVLQQVEAELVAVANTLTGSSGLIAASLEAADASKTLEAAMESQKTAADGLSGIHDRVAQSLRDLPDRKDITIRVENQASESLDKINQDLEGLGKMALKVGAVVGSAVAAFVASKAAVGALSKMTEEFYKSEKAARGLTDAQREFSESLQIALGIQDDVVNRLQRQARLLGIATEQQQEATRAAIGLAESLGISVESALYKVNEAINGNANALASYIPAIRDAETESEKLALVSQAAARGLSELTDAATAGEVAINRWEAANADLVESIGGMVQPSVEVGNTMAALTTVAAELIDKLSERMGDFGAVVSVTMEGFKTAAVGAFAAAETAIDNFGMVLDLGMKSAELAIIGYVEMLKHAFTVEAPAYVEWFGENFFNLIQDAANAVMKVFQNLGHNIGEAMAAIWTWVQGGMQGGVEGLMTQLGESMFKGLTEGFEAQTEPLPDIIGRQLTDREQELIGQIAALGGKLGSEFSDNFGDRMEQVNKLIGDMTADVNASIDLQAGDSLDKLADKAGKAGDPGPLQATESRLLTRGESDTPISQIATFTERTAKGIEKLPEQMAGKIIDAMRIGQQTLGNDTIDIKLVV